MSADLLRAAAALMRSRAEALQSGPWHLEHIDPAVVPSEDGEHRWFVMEPSTGPYAVCTWEPSAAHIAGMHPAVALAVADWLDEAADFLAAYPGETHAMDNPLSVALAYLGRDS